MKFIHEKSNIEGDVELEDWVSIWPFASIRGDEGKITIGENSSVQDNVTIHGKTTIGKNVTIGHGAIIHKAKIGNNVVIGMNSTILDDAEIGDWCIIAAGSLVTGKTKIDPESLVMGVPGKISRKLTETDKDYITKACQDYLDKFKRKH